jgi:hypothetical protein
MAGKKNLKEIQDLKKIKLYPSKSCKVCKSCDLSNERQLSFRAKGILHTLSMKPESCMSTKTFLRLNSTDGSCSLQSGLRELAIKGYIILKPHIMANGRTVRHYEINKDSL